jgi:hypothetical protein
MYGPVPPVNVPVTVPSPPLHDGSVPSAETVNPALKETGIGSTKSSKVAVSDVEVFVLMKTVLI